MAITIMTQYGDVRRDRRYEDVKSLEGESESRKNSYKLCSREKTRVML